jgi:hypothetical protein
MEILNVRRTVIAHTNNNKKTLKSLIFISQSISFHAAIIFLAKTGYRPTSEFECSFLFSFGLFF